MVKAAKVVKCGNEGGCGGGNEDGDEGWMIDSERLDCNILQSLIVKMKQKQTIITK